MGNWDDAAEESLEGGRRRETWDERIGRLASEPKYRTPAADPDHPTPGVTRRATEESAE